MCEREERLVPCREVLKLSVERVLEDRLRYVIVLNIVNDTPIPRKMFRSREARRKKSFNRFFFSGSRHLTVDCVCGRPFNLSEISLFFFIPLLFLC